MVFSSLVTVLLTIGAGVSSFPATPVGSVPFAAAWFAACLSLFLVTLAVGLSEAPMPTRP